MPTKLRRHSITETPRVRDALEPLRRRGVPVELGDLVVRGAADRLREVEAEEPEEQRKARLRQRLVERLRTGKGIDIAAAYEVREHGWTH
jgi:hypothetical protein